MEYIFLVAYTLVILLIGFLVALLWLKKPRDKRSVRWVSGLF